MNGIMTTPSAVIDVRDMMCAQALAVVARALGQLPDGAALEIRYNTLDVKRDLLLWARDRQLLIEEGDQATVRIIRAHA